MALRGKEQVITIIMKKIINQVIEEENSFYRLRNYIGYNKNHDRMYNKLSNFQTMYRKINRIFRNNCTSRNGITFFANLGDACRKI